MPTKLSYTVFDTAAGWMALLGSSNGLLRTILPRRSAGEAQRLLGKITDDAASSPDMFQELVARFRAYFGGQAVAFPDPLDLSSATDFQRRVWTATRQIPYGATRSYSWIAEQIQNPAAARAVGQALGANPLPVIVPCHRVLASNGGLGGFSGGLKVKRQLLKLEGAANFK